MTGRAGDQRTLGKSPLLLYVARGRGRVAAGARGHVAFGKGFFVAACAARMHGILQRENGPHVRLAVMAVRAVLRLGFNLRTVMTGQTVDVQLPGVPGMSPLLVRERHVMACRAGGRIHGDGMSLEGGVELQPVAGAAVLTGLYGITADSADEDKEVPVYLTGEFFAAGLALPNNVTVDDVEVPLRNLGIFLK